MNYEDLFNYFAIQDSKRDFPDQWKLNELLSEGLIMTHDIDNSLQILVKSGANIVSHTKDKFKIKFKGSGEFDKLMVVIGNLGWFPVRIEPAKFDLTAPPKPYTESNLKKMFDEYREVIVTFEAKFDYKLPESEFPKFLYHLTQKKNLYRIQRQGLTPREDATKRTYHPPRIYLTGKVDYVRDLSEIFYREKLNVKSNKLEDRGKGIILKIDTLMMPKYFALYADPNFAGKAYFTVNNVPPKLIEVVEEVELK